MTVFWTWFVRNPAFVLAVAGVAAGASGAVAWSLAMPMVAISAVLWELGRYGIRNAHRRARRKAASHAEQTTKVFHDYARAEREKVA